MMMPIGIELSRPSPTYIVNWTLNTLNAGKEHRTLILYVNYLFAWPTSVRAAYPISAP